MAAVVEAIDFRVGVCKVVVDNSFNLAYSQEPFLQSRREVRRNVVALSPARTRQPFVGGNCRGFSLSAESLQLAAD